MTQFPSVFWIAANIPEVAATLCPPLLPIPGSTICSPRPPLPRSAHVGQASRPGDMLPSRYGHLGHCQTRSVLAPLCPSLFSRDQLEKSLCFKSKYWSPSCAFQGHQIFITVYFLNACEALGSFPKETPHVEGVDAADGST